MSGPQKSQQRLSHLRVFGEGVRDFARERHLESSEPNEVRPSFSNKGSRWPSWETISGLGRDQPGSRTVQNGLFCPLELLPKSPSGKRIVLVARGKRVDDLRARARPKRGARNRTWATHRTVQHKIKETKAPQWPSRSWEGTQTHLQLLQTKSSQLNLGGAKETLSPNSLLGWSEKGGWSWHPLYNASTNNAWCSCQVERLLAVSWYDQSSSEAPDQKAAR